MRYPRRYRAFSLLLMVLLVSLVARHLIFAQRSPLPSQLAADTTGRSGIPRWAFWLQQSWAGAELLALLFAAYQLWARRGERRRAEAEVAALALKAANYQAWTVVNSAQGKGGSGGRIDALQDLNRNGVSLAGVRLDGAWLEGVRLPAATLTRSSLRDATLSGARLAGANLEGADLTDANLTGADLTGALLKGADLSGTQLGTADLRQADLAEVKGWATIRTASYMLFEGARHLPGGFRQWALANGAVESEQDQPLDSAEGFSSYFRRV